jgi:hypothetical protein
VWASRSDASSLILVALAMAGSACGRVGYDARAGLAADGAAADAPVDQLAVDRAPDIADVSVEGAAEASLDASPDTSPEASIDAPAPVSAPPPDGTPLCLPPPDPNDLIADFEAGSAATVRFADRGGTTFLLVANGAGDIAVSPPRPVPLCGSFRFMTLQGSNIPADRQGHIQAHLMRSVPGQPTAYFDARAFTGVRLSLRASTALSVMLHLPDRNTTLARPYDHFGITLNAGPEWRSYVVPFRDLRQAGNGMCFPAVDAQSLFAVEIAVIGATTFELSIDDIGFVR